MIIVKQNIWLVRVSDGDDGDDAPPPSTSTRLLKQEQVKLVVYGMDCMSRRCRRRRRLI